MRSLAICTSLLAAGVSLLCIKSIGSHQPKLVRSAAPAAAAVLWCCVCERLLCAQELTCVRSVASSCMIVKPLQMFFFLPITHTEPRDGLRCVPAVLAHVSQLPSGRCALLFCTTLPLWT